MYGIMWRFAVYLQTPLLKFPIEMRKKMAVKIYIVIFMAIVVPLSCTSIVDQSSDPGDIRGGLRDGYLDAWYMAAAYGRRASTSQVGPVNDVALAEPSNIVQVTMTCVFASMMQFIVPTMADGCRSKTELSQVFGISATLSFFSNLLGILLALFFGQISQTVLTSTGSTSR
jgi:hypothetical protein